MSDYNITIYLPGKVAILLEEFYSCETVYNTTTYVMPTEFISVSLINEKDIHVSETIDFESLLSDKIGIGLWGALSRENQSKNKYTTHWLTLWWPLSYAVNEPWLLEMPPELLKERLVFELKREGIEAAKPEF
jgi:hypothetical protein